MTRMARIGDIAQVNPRFSKAALVDRRQPVSFLPMSGVSEEGYIAELGERSLTDVAKGYNYFRAGDVLLAKITPCFENGKAAFVGSLPCGVGFGSTEFHVLRPSDEVDGRYLFQMIWNPAFRFVGKRHMTGTAGQKRVPTDFLKRYSIPLPPLAEQRRIAAILDKADAIRRKRRESIKLLEEFLRSAFLEMFADPVRNPKGWPIETLDNVCTRVTVGYVGSMTAEYAEGGIPFLRSLNVRRNRIDLTDMKHVGRNFHKQISKSSLVPGDVVAVRTGKPGVSSVIPRIIPVSNCADLIVMTCGSNIRSDYLSESLNLMLGDRAVIQGSTGAVQTHFNIGRARELRLALPPLRLQERYSDLVVAGRRIQERLEKANSLGATLFDSLAQRAFRGEL